MTDNMEIESYMNKKQKIKDNKEIEDNSIILELVLNNGYFGVQIYIKLKYVSKHFNNFINKYLINYSKNALKNIYTKEYRPYNYFESIILINSNNQNNTENNDICMSIYCDICNNKITKITSLYGYKLLLCREDLNKKFVTLSDAVKKYKIKRKMLEHVMRWKHYKYNKTLFYKQHIKNLYIISNYQKKFKNVKLY